METYDQKRRRLFGRKFLPRYLKELNQIIRGQVHEMNLLTLRETDNIREIKIKGTPHCIKKVERILFNEKEELKTIILGNPERARKGYYVLTSDSIDCGAYKIKSILDFDLDFPFNATQSGIITLIRMDLSEEIILDFFEEQGTQYIDIEIYWK